MESWLLPDNNNKWQARLFSQVLVSQTKCRWTLDMVNPAEPRTWSGEGGKTSNHSINPSSLSASRDKQAHFLNLLAPQTGLEPVTIRLTVDCSTIELLRSKKILTIFPELTSAPCPHNRKKDHWALLVPLLAMQEQGTTSGQRNLSITARYYINILENFKKH